MEDPNSYTLVDRLNLASIACSLVIVNTFACHWLGDCICNLFTQLWSIAVCTTLLRLFIPHADQLAFNSVTAAKRIISWLTEYIYIVCV
jgi:hypothetical protein